MAHFHQHSCECKHENLKLCKTCKVPFCQDCGKEWAEPCKQYHGGWWNGYPYYGTYCGTGVQTSGNLTGTDMTPLTSWKAALQAEHTHHG